MEAANYYNLQRDGDAQKKIELYDRAIILLRQSMPGTKKLADALKYYADLKDFAIEGNTSTIALLKEAVNIYRSLHYEQLQDIYTVLCSTYTSLDNPNEGLKYGILAVQTAERFRDSSLTLCTIYNNLSLSYSHLRNFRKAAECLEKALMIAQRHQDPEYILITLTQLTNAYGSYGAYDKAANVLLQALKRCPKNDYETWAILHVWLMRNYNAAKDYKKGAAIFDILQKIRKDKNFQKKFPHASGESIFTISTDYLIGVKKYKEAKEMLSSMQQSVKGNTRPISLNARAIAMLQQFKIDSAQGHLMDAISSYQRYKALTDTLDQRSHDKKIARLDLEFQTYKKDQEIAENTKSIDHLKKEAILQNIALQGKTRAGNLLIAVAALLALLLVLSYRSYRNKRQANKELNQQQEEINTQNDYLKDLVDERDRLLKEIHHRVKNNLQIVISLLNAQCSYLTDPATLKVLQDSQHRMNSISLIHQKLYQGDDRGLVDMPTYITELTEFLQSSFCEERKFVISTHVTPLTLDVAQAVPLGLIMNEAITNAIKYAFDEAAIFVSVRLSASDNRHFELEIKDNGKGLPENFCYEKADSLGMNLMRGLASQLDGTLRIFNDNGVRVLLKWREYRPLGKV